MAEPVVIAAMVIVRWKAAGAVARPGSAVRVRLRVRGARRTISVEGEGPVGCGHEEEGLGSAASCRRAVMWGQDDVDAALTSTAAVWMMRARWEEMGEAGSAAVHRVWNHSDSTATHLSSTRLHSSEGGRSSSSTQPLHPIDAHSTPQLRRAALPPLTYTAQLLVSEGRTASLRRGDASLRRALPRHPLSSSSCRAHLRPPAPDGVSREGEPAGSWWCHLVGVRCVRA